jgi:hypothetical protein
VQDDRGSAVNAPNTIIFVCFYFQELELIHLVEKIELVPKDPIPSSASGRIGRSAAFVRFVHMLELQDR